MRDSRVCSSSRVLDEVGNIGAWASARLRGSKIPLAYRARPESSVPFCEFPPHTFEMTSAWHLSGKPKQNSHATYFFGCPAEGRIMFALVFKAARTRPVACGPKLALTPQARRWHLESVST